MCPEDEDNYLCATGSLFLEEIGLLKDDYRE